VNTKQSFVAAVAAILAVVAIAGYLWPIPAAEQPVRVLLPNKGGPVVFDHLIHVELTGDCDRCHHTGDYVACGESGCHDAEAADSGLPTRMEAFHQSCMGCHEEVGAGPWEKDQCKQCHLK